MSVDSSHPSFTQSLLQTVLQQVSDVVLILDREASIARCFGEARLGYGDNELDGRSALDLVHDEHVDLAKRTFAMISDSAAIDPIEIRVHHANGSDSWFEVSLVRYSDANDRIWGVAVARDIHERRLVESANRDRERHYRSLVDQSPLGVLVVDRDLNFVSANESYLRQVGAPNLDALQNHNLLSSPALDGQAIEALLARIENGETLSMDLSYRSIFDKQVDVRATISPVEDDSQAIVRVQMLFEDISERRRLEQQLRQSQKMEAVGRLAGGVAHDFNNNLTVIIGLAEFLAEGGNAAGQEHDERRKAATEILNAAERSAALTRQLLTFSRPSPSSLEATDLGLVVERLVPLLRLALGEGIDLRSSFARGLPLIEADPQLLEQVVLNLAVNSRDAMPNGGTVRIDVFEDETGRVVLEVADDGIGMDEATLMRSIEPFFSTKKAGEGTGLGLSMVYGIVRQFRGSVDVESSPGAGARFRMGFPPLDGVTIPDHVGESSEDSLSGTLGSERILIVEDQRPVRTFLSMTLRRQGYDVLEAENGGQALDLARNAEPEIDLLLSDVRMPDLSGPETVSKLRAERPGLRVLYISGYNDVTRAADGRMDDGFELLAKPFSAHRLLERVRTSLDQPSLGTTGHP